MPRRVTLSKSGVRSQVVTDDHHRNGYMRIGSYAKIWCSCGWKAEMDGPYSEMMAAWETHRQLVAS